MFSITNVPHANLVMVWSNAVCMKEAAYEIDIFSEGRSIGIVFAVSIRIIEGKSAGNFTELIHCLRNG